MPSTSLDLRDEILRLKKERNAVILAHNYQTGDIQDLADYVGDSLGLAYQAQETDADVIAFCGVHFMAETAKIVNPEKIVVLPDKDAGCSLEESCPAEDLEKFINENQEKNYYVIAYINCSAQTVLSSLSQMPTSVLGSWSKPAAKWISGRVLVMFTLSSPVIPSIKSKLSILTLSSSLTLSAPPPCASSPMRYAPRRRWSPTAKMHP
jgi:hypothetical protein